MMTITSIHPAHKVPSIGTELTGDSYAALIAQLKEGEKLVGLYDGFLSPRAPYLDSVEVYDAYEGMVAMSIAKRIGFYAVNRTSVKERAHE